MINRACGKPGENAGANAMADENPVNDYDLSSLIQVHGQTESSNDRTKHAGPSPLALNSQLLPISDYRKFTKMVTV